MQYGGRLEIGQRAPEFLARGPSGNPARFYAHAGGRPTVVVFGGGDPQLSELAGHLSARGGVAQCRISPEPPEAGADLPTWSDPEGKAAAAYGVAYGVAGAPLTVVVLDPNLRVLGVATGARLVDEVLALVESAEDDAPAQQVRAQARPYCGRCRRPGATA